MQLTFFDAGVKIDIAYYCNVLLSQQLLPAIRHISGEFFIFQQDSAQAHRAHDTISLLERDAPAFISPHLWPPNSPDLNPVDYKVWSIMQHRIYQTKVKDLDNLKRRLIDVWAGIQQSLIDDAINQWRKCICACVLVQGSAAMSKVWWDVQWSFCIKFCAESSSERILKIH